jgi:hypothetical protein
MTATPTMRSRVPALIVSVLLLAGNAPAWNVPDAFQSVPWGASMQAAKEILEKRAESERLSSARPRCMDDRLCITEGFVGPVLVKSHFKFVDGKFVAGWLNFKSDRYEDIRIIFIDRYGQPTERRQEQVETKMGYKAMNETLYWFGDKVIIRLSRYAGTIEDGSGSVYLKEELDRLERERASEIRKGKDKL